MVPPPLPRVPPLERPPEGLDHDCAKEDADQLQGVGVSNRERYERLQLDQATREEIGRQAKRVLDWGREVYRPCACWAATNIASTASTTSSPTMEITRALGCPLLPVQTKELEKKITTPWQKYQR